MNYRGSCHCGTIAYEVEGDLDQVIQCNCSLCSRRGWLLVRPARPSGAEDAGQRDAHLHLNTHRLQHYFCPTCGCAPFSEGIGPDGQAMAAVNALPGGHRRQRAPGTALRWPQRLTLAQVADHLGLVAAELDAVFLALPLEGVHRVVVLLEQPSIQPRWVSTEPSRPCSSSACTRIAASRW